MDHPVVSRLAQGPRLCRASPEPHSEFYIFFDAEQAGVGIASEHYFCRISFDSKIDQRYNEIAFAPDSWMKKWEERIRRPYYRGKSWYRLRFFN